MSLLTRGRLLCGRVGASLLRLTGRHYFSMVSAGVLIAFVVVVLTNDSFESRESRSAALESRTTPVPEPTRQPRPVVLFYLVDDEAQRDALTEAVHADRLALVADAPRPDFIIYLIAGTKEEEVRTIERLNFEELLARAGGVEMRVIDVRHKSQ